jgi:hypothetical protein
LRGENARAGDFAGFGFRRLKIRRQDRVRAAFAGCSAVLTRGKRQLRESGGCGMTDDLKNLLRDSFTNTVTKWQPPFD